MRGPVAGGLRRPVLACVSGLVLAAPSTAQEGVSRAIESAVRGGVSVVCRHVATGSTREVEPVDYDDPSTQRLLSDEGEEQSRALGRAFRELGVEVTELVASPMRRARRTAELMMARDPAIHGIWHTNGGSYEGEPRERRAEALATPVPRGVRLIVSHIGTMSSVLPEARGEVDEGDCVVVEPRGDGYDVVGIVPFRAWIRAADATDAGNAGDPERETDAPPAQKALAQLPEAA